MKKNNLMFGLAAFLYSWHSAQATADLIDYSGGGVERIYLCLSPYDKIKDVDITASYHEAFKKPIVLLADGTYYGSIGQDNVISTRLLAPAQVTFTHDNTYVAAGGTLKIKYIISTKLLTNVESIPVPTGFTTQAGATTTTAKELLYDKAIYFGLAATLSTTQAQLVTMIDSWRVGLWDTIRASASATSGGLNTIQGIKSRKAADAEILAHP